MIAFCYGKLAKQQERSGEQQRILALQLDMKADRVVCRHSLWESRSANFCQSATPKVQSDD
eukprot:260957-Amphidinium_carterae.2